MSIAAVDIIVQNPPLILEVVTPTNRPVIEVVVSQGLPGAPGAGTAVIEIPLTVETNGQTEFNIFSIPAPGQITELVINGVGYFEIENYNFQTIGGNSKLVWLNQFTLSTTDIIKFKKY